MKDHWSLEIILQRTMEEDRIGSTQPNQQHLDLLIQQKGSWNEWRRKHPEIIPYLRQALLNGVNLRRINLSQAKLTFARLNGTKLIGANLNHSELSFAKLIEANLSKSTLIGANLSFADLSGADLSGADLSGADLFEADLSNANLSNANLSRVVLSKADLSNANLRKVDLSEASLVGTILANANLTDCRIYGISAWDVQLENTIQLNLKITPKDQPTITVDNLKIAQFIYLLLNNHEIRDILDTITSKVILILGRFTPERKEILDALRDELRKRNYLPILFDFEKPMNRDVTETVSTLAHLARFVIADITEPKSIPHELSHIIPFLPSVPIVPLLQVSEHEYGMFEHFISYPWVQPTYHYHDLEELLHSLQEHILDAAEKKVRELAIEKAKRLERP